MTIPGGTGDTATTATDIIGGDSRNDDSGLEAANARGNSVAITGNASAGGRNNGGQVNGSGTGSGNSFLIDTTGAVKDAGWIAVGFVDFNDCRLEGNGVEVASGTFDLAAADIVGGAGRGPDSWSLSANIGNASGNSVAMTGSVPVGNTRGMFGGQDDGAGPGFVNSALTGTTGGISEEGGIAGGLVDFPDGELNGNKVDTHDGVIKAAAGIYGSARSQFQAAGLAVNASGDSVSAYGGDVSGNSIYGAWTDLGTATSDSVALSRAPILADVGLYGGFPRPGGDAFIGFIGNTLKVVDYGGTSTLGDIGNFENFDFRLSSSTGNGDTILSTASLELGGPGQASRVSSLGVADGGAILRPGDTITLIRSGATTGLFENSTLSASKGVTILYDIAASLDGAGNMVATVVNSSAHPQSKALSEGYLSGQALLSQAADLATGKGISQAVANAHGSGPRAFGAFGGGSLRHKTGSRVNVEGYSFLLGLAHGWDLGHGRLILGGFLEYGMGDFDTNNSFASSPSVFGEGNTEYLGGGLLARLDLEEGSHGHGYLEASGRFGRVEGDFSSRDFVSFRNVVVSYETSSHYYSAHLGVGYVFKFSEDESLDLYAKYMMTHQRGDSVVLSSGDPVNFDSVNSKRVKAGARFSFAVNEHVSPFFGLAFEHEFDGKAGASSHGFRLDVPKLKGSTVIGELGLSVRTGSAVSFDLGVQGHLGNRRGVSGSLLLNVTF
ncbi:MAG: autotransporter outer membrane beta-barrel domain-containing protein [Deltaproteobacteria bacterium]|nr:autotransporter outer membrane beta-barrel domain-containing protein [Deltaproteobacteria bacterium]